MEAARRQIADGEAQIGQGRQELESQKAVLEQSRQQIVSGTAQIADAKSQLADGEAQIADARKTLEDAAAELADGRAQLEEKEQELADAKQEYEDAYAKAQPELTDARQQIADGEQELADLAVPQWYVTDRDDITSAKGFADDSQRIDNLGQVFPLMFFLVAALISLTTMTRMVDEQRSMIGTYKALGYSKVAIAMKYVLYALVAGIVGSVIGCLIGMHLFPSVIFYAWNLMYNLPDLQFEIQIPLALQASLSVIAVTIAATIFACYHELVEVPALLMRPKAPKNGKKIMLVR